MKKQYSKWLAVGVVGALTLTGCSSKTVTPTEKPTQTGETTKPVAGGTVTLSMYSAPKGLLNPVLYEDQYDSYAFQFAFDSLMDQNDDLSFKPALAEKWDFSEDKKTITFHINPKAKWHDGQPVTADDVAFTYKSIASKDYTDKVKGPRFYVVENIQGAKEFNEGKATDVSGIKVVDPQTIAITVVEPSPAALANINFPIIPKHVFEKIPLEQWVTAPETKEKIVGDGPYKITKVTPGESVVLERFDDYYQGKPGLDKIIWKVVEQAVAPGLLETGELDIMTDVGPKDVDNLKSDTKVSIFEAPDFGYQYMGFKLNNPKLQDKKLRQAMAYAINRKGMVDGLLKGHGIVLNAPMPPAIWAAAKDSDLNAYAYSPDKAKQVLDEAGYKDRDGDGLREDPKGNKLEISLDYPTGNKVREASAPIIQKDLQTVGLNINMKSPRDFATHADAVKNDQVDMYLMGWSLDTTDPDPSGIWGKKAAYNYPHYDSAESEKLIQDAMSLKAYDQAYRTDAYIKWQKVINDDLPVVFLYSQNKAWAYNKRIQNVHTNALGIFTDVWKWSVK